MDVLNIISDNLVVFIILVAILVINFCCILFLIIKERKDDKKEIKEILEELNPKEEVDSKLEEEQDKKLEQNKKEVEDMLLKMQKDLETKPADVVSTFENEQEEKSIISYQELLDSVKNSNEVKVTPVKVEPEKIEIDDDSMENTVIIETEPDEIDFNYIEEKPMKIENTIEGVPVIEEIVEEKQEEPKKFKGTDFISPIFGRQENNIKYPSVPKRKTRLDNFMVENNKKSDKIEEPKLNLVDTQKLDEELRKNDDFLKSLKEFRKNLD